MEEIFVTAVKMLAAKGYVKLVNCFQDGTKTGSMSRRNEWLLRLRRKARRTLEEYSELRKRRSVEVETVFGQIKGNQGIGDFCRAAWKKCQLNGDCLFLGAI